jgi:hypothetical protein
MKRAVIPAPIRNRASKAFAAAATAVVVTVCLAAPAAGQAVNVPPLSCSPSTLTFGTTATCTATGSPGETFTFPKPQFGSLSASSCTIPAFAESCSLSYRPVDAGITDAISSNSDLFSGAATTIVTTVGRAPTDILACLQSTIVLGQSASCTATVSPGNQAVTFTGTDGAFTPPSCTTSATGSCSVLYTPTIASLGQLLTGNFDDGASVMTRQTVVRPISPSVSCVPGSLLPVVSTTCTATVTDSAPGATTPTGTVGFATSGPGSFSAGRCNLAGAGSSATCSVSYTPSAVGSGTHMISTTYSGDPTHAVNTASTPVAVVGRSTAAAVLCSPGIVASGKSASCTATIRDADSGTRMTPNGLVSFTSGGAGSFGGTGTCVLGGSGASASCKISYTAGSQATATQTITAVYGGDAVHAGSNGSTTVALPPQTGVTADVTVLSGVVLITVPGSVRAAIRATDATSPGSFFPIKGVTRSVPVGSTVDTRKGVVRLVTAADDRPPSNPHHETQSGTFAAAEFTIKQMTTAQRLAAAHREHKRRLTGIPATNLLLSNPFSAFAHAHCTRTRHPSHGVVRQLSAVAKGLYRTVGAASTTVVHNATWIVKDRCDGTFTEVGRGSAVVQYKVHGRQRSQVVKPGEAFLVRRPFLPPLRKGR